MKKTLVTALLLSVIFINIGAILILVPGSPFNVKQAVYIAIIGPMSGKDKKDGELMLKGAKLYFDKIKETGRFKDKKIELLVYDDTDKQSAVKIASQIAEEEKVLLVIGHYTSTNSTVAGMIYQKNGIPAITASATSETVTKDNGWYFRIIPGKRFMRSFIANYMKNALNRTSASIIYDIGVYYSYLARGFETTALELGIDIRNRWEYDSNAEDANYQLVNIIGRLRSAAEPGMIFCASPSADGVRLLTSSRYPGNDYAVVGPDAFSTPFFINKFNDYPRERLSPGYYSDGIYAVAPFFAHMADKGPASSFRDEYLKKYKNEPFWLAACYYDATLVALKAIERAEIQGQDILKDRKRVRDALFKFNSYGSSLKGVTGDIYFDADGNATRALAMGFWHKQKLIPAYMQYHEKHPLPDVKEDNEQATEDTEMPEGEIKIDDLIMAETRVVYSGIDINEIRNLNPDKGTYTADFYLWFRFRGEFDDTRIIFMNSVNPIRLGQPFMESATGDITTRSYRVIADFKIVNKTYDMFPFDHQILGISFRHADRARDELIYIPDVMGLPQAASGVKFKENKMVRPIAGWNINDISFSQDIAEIDGPDKKTLSYSLLNANIRIKRKNLVSVFLKSLFPIIIMAVILYFVYFMPPDQPMIRTFIFMPVILITGLTHYLLSDLISAYKLIVYSFFTIYALGGMSALISIFIYVIYKHGGAGKVIFLTRAGKIIHPFLASLVILFIYTYIFR